MNLIKTIFSSIIYYTMIITLGVYITVTTLAYFKFDEFRVYMPNEIIELLKLDFIKYNFLSLMALLLFFYMFVAYVKNEYKRYKERHNLQPLIVTLEELSQIWLGEKESTFVVKEKTKFVEIGEFENKRTKELIRNYISPPEYIKFFPEEKLNIIIQLFRMLEEGGAVSSVASKFKSDPEKTGNFSNAIDTTGKTSYDVFSKISLYEHTMDVVDESINFMKDKEGEFFMMNLCDAIIVALAHDIGKMEKIRNLEEGAVNQIITQNPHQTVSVLFFTQLFGTEYESIREAIANHHSAATSGSRLTRMIIYADKQARKKELENYLNSQRQKIVEAKPTAIKEEDTKEDVPQVKDNLATKPKPKEPDADKNQDKDKLSPLKRRRRIPATSKKDDTPTLFDDNPNEDKSSSVEDNKVVSDDILPKEEPNPINVIEIDFNENLERLIIDELSQNINKCGPDEKITSIKSVSFQDSVLFSITFFNSVVEKYVYIDKSLSKSEYKETLHGICRYVIGKLIEKNYTNYIAKGFYFSTFPCVADDKKGKLLAVPIKGEIFNLDTLLLETMKNGFLKRIQISTYNGK